ncbi:hypothetical protein chiPu_0009763 [Chiloscyllium punctatum]|uniref:Uncharacterized protein n=1 Tax=Chiloscyllium punctatum TaxID=137246 RepID=A0A401SLQ0_CHIPU|nr:hypothetical protein [Chiloscyllium punctatum]
MISLESGFRRLLRRRFGSDKLDGRCDGLKLVCFRHVVPPTDLVLSKVDSEHQLSNVTQTQDNISQALEAKEEQGWRNPTRFCLTGLCGTGAML